VTGAKIELAADAMLSFEFACERRCQVEVDVTEERGGITLNGLRQSALAAHSQAHLRPPRPYRFADNILVRAAILTPAVAR
jgi:hypothetical protein